MFQIKEVGVLYVINLISFLLSVVDILGFSFPLSAINWVSARRISTKMILHYDIITLWHYEISSHFVKLTTFKIFHLKNMPFHKAWQAARHFISSFKAWDALLGISGFFCMYIQRKRKLLMSLSCYLAYRDPCVFRFICFPIFKQHLPTYPKDYFMAIFTLSDYVTYGLWLFLLKSIFLWS